MEDGCIYQIQIRGQINEDDLNSMSPLKLSVEEVKETSTTVTAATDQSGMIGLVRHLHGLGFVLLSVIRSKTE